MERQCTQLDAIAMHPISQPDRATIERFVNRRNGSRHLAGMVSSRSKFIVSFLYVWFALASQNAFAQASSCSATTDKTVAICSPDAGSTVVTPVQFAGAAPR